MSKHCGRFPDSGPILLYVRTFMQASSQVFKKIVDFPNQDRLVASLNH